jgi:hypothetical protein
MVSEKVMNTWFLIIGNCTDRNQLMKWEATTLERLRDNDFTIKDKNFNWSHKQLTILRLAINQQIQTLSVIDLLEIQ